jgi:ubiquitin carboxyl-terminal hydrolase 4/11/15
MNSVLQCLAHTQPLTNYFLTAHEDTFEVHSLKGIANIIHNFVLFCDGHCSISEVCRKLWQDTTLTCFEPRRLRTVFSSSTFYIGSGQQDAPEFLDFFLQKLHDAMNNPETSIHAVDDNSNSNDPNKLAIVAWSKKLSMDYSFVSGIQCPFVVKYLP